jgi:hypothetical protein
MKVPMASRFDPPKLPATPNVHGLPRPPSGLHPSTSPAAVLIPTGGVPVAGPPRADNIHRGLARLFHRGSYDVLESVR